MKRKHRRFRRFFGKSNKLAKYLFGIPIMVTTIALLAFFLSDEFLLYSKLYLFNNEISTEGAGNPVPPSITVNTGSEGSDPEKVTGAAGIEMMLVNKMRAGYYQEYLAIIRDHCNWKYMDDAIKPYMVDGKPFYPSVFSVLGGSLAESGLWNGKGPAPLSAMKEEDYKTKPYFTLYQLNSPAFKEAGFAHINGCGPDMKRGSYYTHLQMTRWVGSVFPDHTTGEGSMYPSKLHGYKDSDSKIRTKKDTDLAFFPDQISCYLQSSYMRFESKGEEALSVASLDKGAEVGACYSVHNGGPGVIRNSWGCGGRGGTDYSWTPKNSEFGADAKWNKKNTFTKIEGGSSAVNLLHGLCREENTFIAANVSNIGFNWANQTDYEGLAFMDLMLGAGGFIATQRSLDNVEFRMGSAGFLRGALISYRNHKNNPTATTDDVLAYMKSLTVKPLDTSFYGPATQGKTGSLHEIVVHCYDESLTVYNNSGAGPRKLLHSYPLESTRGYYMAEIGGPYIYWKMLLASGVEVTLADATKDGYGELAMEPTGSGGSGDTSDYYAGVGAIGSFLSSQKLPSSNSIMYYRHLGISRGLHSGEDFPLRQDTPLVAMADGVVSVAKGGVARDRNGNGGCGNYVTVTVTNKNANSPPIRYTYMHMNTISVKVGQVVKEGEKLGESGNTGSSGGAHVHVNVQVLRPNPPATVKEGHRNLYMSFTGLASGWYSVEYAPGMSYKGKTDGGKVYDKNWKHIGTVVDTGATEMKDIYAGTATYANSGINKFKEAALKAK